ncbi:glycosyltransferase domain-containing protein [Gracilimonas sp. BCB1]|uniref:glycosyltransferase domain-containing protein n=1 Tax=Gracilimonas sp. BCB1 TaxID=3152362 RepID=UPI0032D946CD
MKFVTVATHSTPDFEIFRKSAEHHKVSFDILGWGKEYTSHKCKSIWLIEYLINLPNDEIVFYTDGYDALILTSEEEILRNFNRLNHSVIYSAEQNINFDGPFIKKVATYLRVKKGKKPYQFLNAGQWIGRAGAVLNIIKETLSSDEFDSDNNNDQSLLIEYMSHYPDAIKLDYDNLIFSCTAGRTGLEKLDYSIKNDRIFNNITETTPCSIHFAAKNFEGANWVVSQVSFLHDVVFTSQTPQYSWYKFKNRLIDLTCQDNFLFHLVVHFLLVIVILLLAGYLFLFLLY